VLSWCFSFFEIGDGSADVDVERLVADDQRRHGSHPEHFDPRDAPSGFAQMDDLDVKTRRVDRVRELLLGGDTDRAIGVVEDGRWLQVRTPNDMGRKKPHPR
jgi:hypothetical protein